MYSNHDICVSCIKGKQTKSVKQAGTQCKGLLEVKHTYVCGPFPTTWINGENMVLLHKYPMSGTP